MKLLSETSDSQMPPTVLVLETSSFWTAELQRQFTDETIGVRRRDQIDEASRLLETGTIGLLVIGLEIPIPSVLRLLTSLQQQNQASRVVVIIPPENRDLEWTLRELGAHEVLPMPFSGTQLATVIGRQLRMIDRESPIPSVS